MKKKRNTFESYTSSFIIQYPKKSIEEIIDDIERHISYEIANWSGRGPTKGQINRAKNFADATKMLRLNQ